MSNNGFVKLSNVDMVTEPTESANVLIEENGEIKRAPKSAVGGAKEVEPDMVISIDKSSFYIYNNGLNPEEIRIVSGSIDNIQNALLNQRMPVVKIVHYNNDSNHYFTAEEYTSCYVYTHDTYVEIRYINIQGVSTIGIENRNGVDTIIYYLLGDYTFQPHSCGYQFSI